MMKNILALVVQAVTIALIIFASRWLFSARGSDTPKVRGNRRVYTIKWQWQAVGSAGVVLGAFGGIESVRDLSSAPRIVSVVILLTVMLCGLWISIGTLTTDQDRITKSALGFSRSLRWKDLTEIRYHRAKGGAIEIRAGLKKIVVDSRFNATKFLLDEIIARTHLSPIFDS